MPVADELIGVMTEYRQLVADLRAMIEDVRKDSLLEKGDLQSQEARMAFLSLSEKAAAMEKAVSRLRLEV
jgi:hypothetical protein